MPEKMMITKIVRTEPNRADLYGRDHRYKDTTLFNLTDLVHVGFDDPADLPIGTDIPCRFWLHYTLSEKLNSAGNRYKDVLSLESIDIPATSTSTDTTAIVAELRAIKALLLQLVRQEQHTDPEPTNELADTLRRTLTEPDPDPFDNVAELHSPLPEADPTLTPHAARQQFYTFASTAMATGAIPAQRVNELVRGANGSGWANALALLQHALGGTS